MNDLLIHPKTKQLLDIQLSSPSQSILLTGYTGSNKYAIARELAADILGIQASKLGGFAYFMDIAKIDNISIDDIRSIQNFIKLKVPASTDKNINRVVLIDSAEKMRTEAQNALLKTLEEPPVGTMIILTTSHKYKLLDTINSRMQEVEVLPVSRDLAYQFYKQKGQALDNFDSMYALSQGLSGLLDALINNGQHPLVADISRAKSIFAETKGHRLLRTDDIAKDKELASRLLTAMLKISHAALTAASKKNDQKSIVRWTSTQKNVVQSIVYLKSNVSTKLIFDNLFISI